MPSLLLDEQLSPEVATQITLKRPEISIVSIHVWHDGQYMATQDDKILIAANDESLTLITYDQKTIMPLITVWGHIGLSHGVVIFVDDKTIDQVDIGSLVRSIIAQWDLDKDKPWTDVVSFLRDVT